jgi:hypothetical protein
MAAHPGRSRLGGVKWTGLDSFLTELRVLDVGMKDEAEEIFRSIAESARAAIAAAYPVQSGSLARGVVIRTPKQPGILLAGVELVQTAPHGWVYEKGTKPRENKAGQNRGAMPARPVFDPIAARYKQAAIDAVIRRLEAKGASRVTRELA